MVFHRCALTFSWLSFYAKEDVIELVLCLHRTSGMSCRPTYQPQIHADHCQTVHGMDYNMLMIGRTRNMSCCDAFACLELLPWLPSSRDYRIGSFDPVAVGVVVCSSTGETSALLAEWVSYVFKVSELKKFRYTSRPSIELFLFFTSLPPLLASGP